jgi:hypothetical protein
MHKGRVIAMLRHPVLVAEEMYVEYLQRQQQRRMMTTTTAMKTSASSSSSLGYTV